jgi:AP-1 complex subunit gamma-1
MPSPTMSIQTREYGLIALAKLATRFSSSTEHIHALIRRYGAHMNLELQQRAVEFSKLLQNDELKYGLLERMPVIEHNNLNAAAAPIEGYEEQRESDALLFDASDQTGQGNYKNDLLDLMGIGGDSEIKPVTNNGNTASKQSSNKIFGLEDLLGGLSENNRSLDFNGQPPSVATNQLDPFADFLGTGINGSDSNEKLVE